MRHPIRWVPSLYFVQGLQFFVVMLIAGLMFKNMGVANDQIARWTGLLGLAWAFKPLWSPFLELARSKKAVVVGLQFCGAASLALLAGALQLPHWFAASIAVLFLLAYSSATHDIAADGLYIASLSAKLQAAYAGWQGAFFNAAKFISLGGLVILNIAATGFATRWGSGAVGLPSSAVLNLALLWGSLLMVSGRRSRSAPEGTRSP